MLLTCRVSFYANDEKPFIAPKSCGVEVEMNIKERVALFSVIAAVLLTTTKLTVGAYTNSLGIISEALHSGIDLIAAVMTLFAVKAAARPPDEDYMYGHEKVESLSSLGEVVLLFITAAWIVYEAVNRLVFGAPHLNLGGRPWRSCFCRYRGLHAVPALLSTAKKYKSQALEADGIHFSTDSFLGGRHHRHPADHGWRTTSTPTRL